MYLPNDNLISVETDLPMRWFYFLTRIGLWIVGIGMILVGCAILLGLQYLMVGIDPSMLYVQSHALLLTDFAYGIVCIGIGVCCIITRFRLAQFRKGSPNLVYITHTLLVLTPMIYTVLSGICIGESPVDLLNLQLAAQFVGLVAGIVLHVIYFNKRSHLFYM